MSSSNITPDPNPDPSPSQVADSTQPRNLSSTSLNGSGNAALSAQPTQPTQPTQYTLRHEFDWVSSIQSGFGWGLGLSVAVVLVSLTLDILLPTSQPALVNQAPVTVHIATPSYRGTPTVIEG
jgi:hypothetical protein